LLRGWERLLSEGLGKGDGRGIGKVRLGKLRLVLFAILSNEILMGCYN